MIVLPGWIYGLSAGLLCGLVYGILQFVLGPYVLTLPQVLFDYVFAFMVMGLSGLFCRMKNGLIPAYIVAVIGRWIMATIAGSLLHGLQWLLHRRRGGGDAGNSYGSLRTAGT